MKKNVDIYRSIYANWAMRMEELKKQMASHKIEFKTVYDLWSRGELDDILKVMRREEEIQDQLSDMEFEFDETCMVEITEDEE